MSAWSGNRRVIDLMDAVLDVARFSHDSATTTKTAFVENESSWLRRPRSSKNANRQSEEEYVPNDRKRMDSMKGREYSIHYYNTLDKNKAPMAHTHEDSNRTYRRRRYVALALIAGAALINIASTTFTIHRTDTTVFAAIGRQHLRTDDILVPSITANTSISLLDKRVDGQAERQENEIPMGIPPATRTKQMTTKTPVEAEYDNPVGDPDDEEPTSEEIEGPEASDPEDDRDNDILAMDLANDRETTLSTAIDKPVGRALETLLVHYTAQDRSDWMETAWIDTNGPLIEIRYYDDVASHDLVAQYRPHFLHTYETQLSPVERADYFRYLVLWVFGGLYIDSDVCFIRSVDQWLHTFDWDPNHDGVRLLQTLDLVVGVEFAFPQTGYDQIGWLSLQLTQFVIAGAKNSPILERILDSVEHFVETIARDGDVERTLQRTGPAAFTHAILNEIEARGLVTASLEQMHKTYASDTRYPRALLPPDELDKKGQHIPLHRLDNSFDHLLVLPYRSFGFYPDHGYAKEAILTRHLFQNSWRQVKRSRTCSKW